MVWDSKHAGDDSAAYAEPLVFSRTFQNTVQNNRAKRQVAVQFNYKIEILAGKNGIPVIKRLDDPSAIFTEPPVCTVYRFFPGSVFFAASS